MIKIIKQNKYFIFTFISIICVIGWFLNFNIWHIFWPYFLFSIFYFFINSIWLGKILAKLLNLEKELQFFFGLFLLLFLVAFGMAVPIFFYKVTPFWLFSLLLFLTLIISILNHLKYFSEESEVSFKNLEDDQGFRISKICYLLFAICYLLALILLFHSRTGNFILSPWEVIRPYYLYLWFGVVFITGLFIFSKEKIWRILLIIILASLLLHAYLPVIYETGFGGDKWRHLGAERWLMEGKIYSPALFGEPINWKQIGPLRIPEIFIVGNKNSYVNMWGLTIALSWLLKIDVFWIDLLLNYLLYSILFPFLMFKFAQFFSQKKSFLLLFSFLPLCFSPFQMYGSITLPNTFGFIWFLFVLTLIIKFFIQPDKQLFFITIIAVLFCYFNYILYFILVLEIILLLLLLKKLCSAKNKIFRKGLIIGCLIFIILCLFIIPVADLVSQYSSFINWSEIKLNILKNLIDFGKRLITSQAIFPRFNDMEQDNWLFVQISRNLNRSILLKLIPWHLILTPIVWLFVIFGLIKFKKIKYPQLGILIIILLFTILINQFIATYFMSGSRIFSKRLVVMTSFLISFFLALGFHYWIEIKYFSSKTKIIMIILYLSLLSTIVYASGPRSQMLTASELKAAVYIWDILKTKSGPYCVLGNTWPLLGLEAISGRQITTGGFPYYYEYRQPERVQLFEQMNRAPSIRYIEKALEITGADECYFMTEERWIYPFQKRQIISRLDGIMTQIQRIDDVYIWKYNTLSK